LREIQAGLDGRTRLNIVWPRLPLYDEDEAAADALGAVHVFREAIAAADGLVICTPGI